MDDSSLDLDPDGVVDVARGIEELAHRLRSVAPLSGQDALIPWADELPRIGTELHRVEELLREVAHSAAATDDAMAAWFARYGDA